MTRMSCLARARHAGRLDRFPVKPTKKGTGFVQFLGPHMQWHIAIAVITIASMWSDACIDEAVGQTLLVWGLAGCAVVASEVKGPHPCPRGRVPWVGA